MLGIGMNEMIIILIIALIVIGPKQLPEIARMLGKGMAVLRKARDELDHELRESIDLERHVSRFRSDMEKYIEDEQSSITESEGKLDSEPAPEAGDKPVQPEKEAHGASDQLSQEDGSTGEKPLAAAETERLETEKTGQAEEAAQSEGKERPTEEFHG